MIHESYIWKIELYKCFQKIAKFRHLKRPSEKSYVSVEKSLMIGAYIIRKLNDAEKIPPHFLEEKLKLGFLKNKGNIVDHFNWHRIDKHYDFENKREIEKDWRFIINQIIHSFTFFLLYDDNGKFDGFLLNSDSTKKDALFFLPLKELLTFFLKISEGTITSSSSFRKFTKGEDGVPKPSVMKLKQAEYSHPDDFDLQENILKTMNGDVYCRK